MILIRPELQARFWHWREALAAAAVAVLGGWLLWRGLRWQDWMLQGLGGLVLAGALAALYAAVQRARFRVPDGAPGIVRVTERRIVYMGPYDGGAVSLQSIVEVALVPGPGGRHWALCRAGEPALMIPLGALGAEALFDAFAALPGLDPARLARSVERPAPEPVIVWARRVLPKD